MSKKVIALSVAEQLGVSRAQAERSVDAVLEALAKQFQAGQEVRLTGFGTFKVKTVKEREFTSPLKNEKVVKPAHKTVGFKLSETLQEKL